MKKKSGSNGFVFLVCAVISFVPMAMGGRWMWCVFNVSSGTYEILGKAIVFIMSLGLVAVSGWMIVESFKEFWCPPKRK